MLEFIELEKNKILKFNSFRLDKNHLFLRKDFIKELLEFRDCKLEKYSNILSESLMEVLWEKNQYINLKKVDYRKIRDTYKKLLMGEITVDIAENYIITILKKYDEIKILANLSIGSIPSSQYSADFQIKLLNLKEIDEESKILDIGSGKDANLVNYLRNKGYKAYGLDRLFTKKEDYLFQDSWLDYNYKKESWDIIISHMAFSNHFKREKLKKKGLEKLYLFKYMEILDSLKKGGVFIYTPSLISIEEKLPKTNYSVKRYKKLNSFALEDIGITIIKKKGTPNI